METSTIEESLRKVGSNFHVVTPRDTKTPALRGHYGLLSLRSGLHLHFSDAIDLHDMITRLEQRPGLTIQVFLQGPVDASVGGRSLFPEDDGHALTDTGPRALMTARARPELFERRGQKGTRVRKVSVTLSHDWLAESDLGAVDSAFDIRRFSQNHLAQCCWRPNQRVVALAETILSEAHYTGSFRTLHLESRVLDLIATVFSSLAHDPAPQPGRSLCMRDLRRMRVIEEYLDAAGPETVTLEEMARMVRISVSTLQRLFQVVHGMSAFEFVRRRNLERARFALDHQGLSVKEAAYLAGYSNPANFSTAFRRHFGRSPRHARREPPAS